MVVCVVCCRLFSSVSVSVVWGAYVPQGGFVPITEPLTQPPQLCTSIILSTLKIAILANED